MEHRVGFKHYLVLLMMMNLFFLLFIIHILSQTNTAEYHSYERNTDVTAHDHTQNSPVQSKLRRPASARKKKLCNIYAPYRIHIPRNATPYILGYLSSQRGSIAINLYHPDDLISKVINAIGGWEVETTRQLETILLWDVTINLLDFGCNLGVYSLLAAKHGRRVVAIDANIAMVEKLWTSIQMNGFQERITLLWNGLSNVYANVTMKSTERRNEGHAQLTNVNNRTSGNKYGVVSTIAMDDVLEVIDFKRAILKIDIEEHEFEAFQNASKLFDEVDIVAVLMEWLWFRDHHNPEVPNFFLNFFISRKYRPYSSLIQSYPLLGPYSNWPVNIVWKRSS